MTVRYLIKPKGMVPAIEARALPDNYAQNAVNCDLRDGTILALLGLDAGTSLSTTAWRSLFKYGNNWLYWTDADIKVIRGQVAAGNNRLFYTGDGYPKQTDTVLMASSGTPSDTSQYRRLGVTPPAAALTINFVGTGTGTVEDTVSYYYTYVVKWSDGTEEESAPSPATAVTDIEEDEYVYLTGFVVPVLATSGNNVTHVRVYRLNSGSATAEYQLVKVRPATAAGTEAWDTAVASIPLITSPLYDCNATPDGLTTSLGDVSQVEDWDAPPDALAGITQYANGILAGFSGKNVCFSEPLVPSAWPSEHYSPVDYAVVAIGVHNQALIVLTGTFPYRMTGSDPSAIFTQKLEIEQPCLSERGTVSTDFGVIFPSPDGLYLISETGHELLTKDILTKAQWTALAPTGFTHANLISFFYDNVYYGFWAGTDEGFYFDFKEKYIVKLDMGDLIYHGCKDAGTDSLYLLTKVSTTYYAKKWAGGSALTWSYTSKNWETPPVNFGFAMILGDQSVSSQITIIPYGDGSQVQKGGVNWYKQPTSQALFRMPKGKEYRTHKYTLGGTVKCRGFIVATSVEEIEEVMKNL